MTPRTGRRAAFRLPLLLAGAALAGCAALAPPQAAQGAALASCQALAASFSHPATRLLSAAVVPAGGLANAGQPVGEHCLVTGRMNERTSAVDGQAYAIGFEMRLPRDWNGRFLYQGNGGTDGFIAPAVGAFSGGGMLRHALQQGFAVISSDAGHSPAQNPLFGLDPQARLDYGYMAVGSLTPMAKSLIRAAYGKGPERSYIGGSSNGGRHTLVAAARYADAYDGYLAVAPGFNLPRAAVAQLYGAQQWARVATDARNLETALPAQERTLIARAILAKCDALDGAADGLVQDVQACRAAFDLQRDLPTCGGARDGSCLTAAQKSAVAAVYAGARNGKGEPLYARWPYDPGLAQADWANWKFRSSVGRERDPVAVGFIFSTPPADRAIMQDTLKYALDFSMDTDAPRIFASNAAYTQSAMTFMTPPEPANLDAMRQRGAKMIVVHGNSDPVFSVDDTEAWYQAVDARHAGQAASFVRFFRVPGMGHTRGGMATDQFDALSALVAWVEKGEAPDRIMASARGAGNPGGVNAELPADWSPTRTRPLCPYPLVARYVSGDREQASSFSCAR